MTREQALQAGERISRLWPTINQDQLDIVVSTILAEEFDSESTHQAMDALYLENSKFFLLSRLRELVSGHSPEPKTPGQVAAEQAYQRTQKRLEEEYRWREQHAQARPTEEKLEQLSASTRNVIWKQFIQTMQDQPVVKMFERMYERGKLPVSFVAWVEANVEAFAPDRTTQP